MRLTLSLLSACALLAAAAAPAALAQPAPPAADPNAPVRIVVIRDCAEPLLFKIGVSLDGAKPVSLANGTYTVITTRPGEHRMKADWPALAGQLDLDAPLTAAPGQTLYVILQGFTRAYLPDTVARREAANPTLGNVLAPQGKRYDKSESSIGLISEADAAPILAAMDAKTNRRLAVCHPPASFFNITGPQASPGKPLPD